MQLFSFCFLQILLVIDLALAAPQVTLNSNQVVTGLDRDNVEQFLGLPFAEPPLANLRFRRPKAYNGTYHNYQATKYSHSCISINPGRLLTTVDYLTTPLNPILNQVAPAISSLLNTVDNDEDCLYVNVFRPRNSSPKSNLPVMVWIYGGAFIFGAGSTYDGARYVRASQRINQPVIVVTFNYRLGPLGFLGGSAIAAENNGNAGMLDQRLVLEWVQDHINDFGGDPSKVTIFGESAGAMSVFNHMVAKDGDNTYNGKPLFRAAIMQSGSANPFGTITDPFPQQMYQRFANAADCGNLNDADTMSCLRSKPTDVIQRAGNMFPAIEKFGIIPMVAGFSPRADGDFLTKPAFDLLSEGKVAQVPYITGVNEDEGTLFGFLTYSYTDNDWNQFLNQYFYLASDQDKNTVSTLYPNLPSQGCPYRTGLLNILTPQYKRFSSLMNDLMFNAGRRKLLASTPNVMKWTFFSEALHNIAPVLGTFHANDLVWQWFVDAGPFKVYQDYFISFANNLDPNVGVSLRNWPSYTSSSKSMLNIALTYLGTTVDSFRETEIGNFINNYKKYLI